MRLRVVTATVAAAMAVTALAGCRTKIGTAATVNDTRITESRVNGFLAPAGPDASVIANAKASNQVVSPRSQVLQYLVQEQVFERVLSYLNATPSPGQLAAYHDEAASVLLQTTLAGARLDSAIRSGLPKSGISPDFAAVYLRTEELEYAIIKTKSLTQLAELVALIKKAGVQVSVSARYGTWDVNAIGLDGKAVVPAYLSLQPTGGAATSAGSG